MHTEKHPLCTLESMWTCYAAFCLERLKRKTNVQDLKDKVWRKTIKSHSLMAQRYL